MLVASRPHLGGASTPKQEESTRNSGVLLPAGEFKATVYYRGGKEVVRAEGAEELGLITQGTFGPILSTVVVDAAHSTTEWSRWEEGPNGPMAVFRFQVPQAKSHYQASSATFAAADDLGAMAPTAYHGELGIDPHSGTVLRLVLQADPDSGSLMQRADIIVEYGAVMIGGKEYTCPVRSVSIAAGVSPIKLSAPLYVTRLDDVVFSGYHIFRSDFRILPYVPEGSLPEAKNGPTVAEQQTAIEEPGAPRPVTVAQLTEIVGRAKGRHDGDAATEIEHLQLTERLSSPKLAMLRAELPGEKSKTALMAIGDVSVFLDPPPGEIPQRAAPDMAEQTQMMSLVTDYLKKVIPKLPNFYAKRFTTSFEEVWTPVDETGSHMEGALHAVGGYRATVYYQEGKEVVSAKGAQEHGLITRGTFGPILRMVVREAAHSNTTQWSRWEEGPNGPMAVFEFFVPQRESRYVVSGSGEPGMTDPTAYHGEIGIDPSSGTILRFVLEADPELISTMERSDIMVE